MRVRGKDWTCIAWELSVMINHLSSIDHLFDFAQLDSPVMYFMPAAQQQRDEFFALWLSVASTYQSYSSHRWLVINQRCLIANYEVANRQSSALRKRLPPQCARLCSALFQPFWIEFSRKGSLAWNSSTPLVLSLLHFLVHLSPLFAILSLRVLSCATLSEVRRRPLEGRLIYV